MRIVIDIPDSEYLLIKNSELTSFADFSSKECMMHAIRNGIPYEERLTGEWIPVSERLPEDMQEVLVWFEYYRYGDYNCMYQTYGLCHILDGKWSPFINGRTGWQDARVIAWCPMPKPYKEAENES